MADTNHESKVLCSLMFVIMCSTDHQCIWHNMRFDLIWLSSFRLSKNYFSMNLLQMEWEKNGFELYKGVLYKINQDNSSTYRSNSYLVDIFVLGQFRVSGFFFLGSNELYFIYRNEFSEVSTYIQPFEEPNLFSTNFPVWPNFDMYVCAFLEKQNDLKLACFLCSSPSSQSYVLYKIMILLLYSNSKPAWFSLPTVSEERIPFLCSLLSVLGRGTRRACYAPFWKVIY